MLARLRSYSVEIILILLLFAAIAFFGYLGYGLLPTALSQEFSGERALGNAKQQLGFGLRRTGDESSKRASDWLTNELVKLNWAVLIQPFTAANKFQGRNIIAYRTNQKADAPVLLLGTHYDSRLMATADSNAANQTLPTPGANSGASGAALLLELARTLNVNATNHTVCLLFFDAEDNGDLAGWQPHMGSSYFVKHLKDQKELASCNTPQFAILVDQVGNVQQQVAFEQSSDPALRTALLATAATLGYTPHFKPEAHALTVGSHTPFLQAGIRVVMLADYDYRYRYTLDDTADKLSSDSFGAVGRTLEAWLENGADKAPTLP
jgi:hypothetical protein